MAITQTTTTPTTGDKAALLSAASHPRVFRANTFVYPVLSRRSGGVSVGINLNPDKACNFDCIYCQVDRTKAPQERFVAMPQLLNELDAIMTALAPGGALWDEAEFKDLPPEKKHVADIAFSGDGEPTTFKNFYEVISACVALKERIETRLYRSAAKVVVITNATGFDRPDVQRAFELLDRHQGEIWAKLDAGTAAYFKLIDATDFPFEKILALIRECARIRPIVIQSCFMRVNQVPPTTQEIDAYIGRLNDLTQSGARLDRVQVYTVARNPALPIVSSLSNEEVEVIASRVRNEAKLRAEAYFGMIAPSDAQAVEAVK